MKPPVNWSRVLNSILVFALLVTLAYKTNPPPPREVIREVPVETQTLVLPGEMLKLRAGCGKIHRTLERCVSSIYNDCRKNSPDSLMSCVSNNPSFRRCYETHNIDLIKLSEELCEETALPRIAPEDDGDCQQQPDPCDLDRTRSNSTLLAGNLLKRRPPLGARRSI